MYRSDQVGPVRDSAGLALQPRVDVANGVQQREFHVGEFQISAVLMAACPVRYEVQLKIAKADLAGCCDLVRGF